MFLSLSEIAFVSDPNLQFIVTVPDHERATWIWLLVFAYFIPEIGTWFRSIRKCLFKKWDLPDWGDFFSLLITESCPAIGSAIFIFVVLPELDVVKGAMLTNAVCFVPALVMFFSRAPKSLNGMLLVVVDALAVLAQASSFIIWPLIEDKPILYMIPVSVILISVGWWENFVSEKAPLEFIRDLAKQKREGSSKKKNRVYFLYMFISPLKCILFLTATILIFYLRENSVDFLFDNFDIAFRNHNINISEIEPVITSATSPNYDEAIRNGLGTVHPTHYMTAVGVFLTNIISTYLCYVFGKFACMVMIQEFGFAFPLNLSVPVLLSALVGVCGVYTKNECAFTWAVPEYLFFQSPPVYFLNDFVSHQHAWVWLLWLLSQAWVTIHIWSPRCHRLASTEQLFVRPMYDFFFIDQSLALNRRKNEKSKENKPVEPGK